MSTSPWFTTSPHWTSVFNDYKSILLSPNNNNVPPSADSKLADIIERSAKFPIKFPIESVRCSQLIKAKIPEIILEKNIQSTYPVIHEHALYLCSMFLNHQQKFGNRKFYENMSLLQFIDRLLSKRAVSFVGILDRYLLMDGSRGTTNKWDTIGTEDETPPLILENCLSYDEIKLSAFLSVSSHTCFINDGNRFNQGIFEENRNKVEHDGVIIGLIGTRLEKEKVMEYREIMKTKEQNDPQYGYGESFVPTLQSKFMNFYGDVSATYDELLQQMQVSDRYVDLGAGKFFDKLVYERRITLSIDTLLIEANDRAKKQNQMAYIHVVGLGLGVWKIYTEQDKIFMDTFAQRLEFLSEVLTNVSDVCFSYIKHKMAGQYKNGDELQGIKLHMFNREPHAKLLGDDDGKLLVVSYAWDGNALPGNEFWTRSLCGSGDPAAACSTQVAELHNWHINSKASAQNLKIVTLKGLVTFEEYQKLHKDD